MDKFLVIQEARQLTLSRIQIAPDFIIFQSINNQLDYIQSVLEGKCGKEKLKDINLGLYAVREFEESDPEFSEALKKVQYIVYKMVKGLKV
nr:immunity protein Tsi6 family protein [Acinetobacter sp. Marseille-Q1620]